MPLVSTMNVWVRNMTVESRQRKPQALVVVAKAPVGGYVKTRLCPYLNPVQAAGLYECLLSDIAGKMEEFEKADSWLAFAPEGEEYFRRNYFHKRLLTQRGRDLGDRLHHIFVDLFRMSYERVVITDSDSPTVPLSSIERAYEWLSEESCDVVLGPSEDGGYYLVGLKRAAAEIFRAIPWSTHAVLDLTLERASAENLRVGLLPRAYDIDVKENLNRLWQDFMASAETRHLARPLRPRDFNRR
jgi:rSAM/selenodomain-associated transferase 1